MCWGCVLPGTSPHFLPCPAWERSVLVAKVVRFRDFLCGVYVGLCLCCPGTNDWGKFRPPLPPCWAFGLAVHGVSWWEVAPGGSTYCPPTFPPACLLGFLLAFVCLLLSFFDCDNGRDGVTTAETSERLEEVVCHRGFLEKFFPTVFQ